VLRSGPGGPEPENQADRHDLAGAFASLGKIPLGPAAAGGHAAVAPAAVIERAYQVFLVHWQPKKPARRIHPSRAAYG
jgi:hypothetical protein